ncbi:MAG: hypothetical protein ABIC95_04605 [archaeon]
MLSLSTLLLHYKRRDVQEAILANARSREVGTRFLKGGFGKRPDMLAFPADILSFVQNGVSSFHVSEEHWANPLGIVTGMSIADHDALRTGWDLVIDIDFEEWESTLIITDAMVKALRAHGVSSVTAKFSGNKGFHIGVPFAAFSSRVMDADLKEKDIASWFPDGPRRIVEYLTYYIDSPENGFAVSKRLRSIPALAELMRKEGSKVVMDVVCVKCGAHAPTNSQEIEFICEHCDSRQKAPADTRYLICGKCGKHMTKPSMGATDACSSCKGKQFVSRYNLKIDTALVSSRHLYRSVYSLHEKSGLVSVPVDPDRIQEFDRDDANSETLKVSDRVFLDDSSTISGEADTLVREAVDFKPREDPGDEKGDHVRAFEAIGEKAPEALFPPCIIIMLKGIKDGKKRSMFVLVNFLRSVGWGYEDIEKLLAEWNARNHEPLREVNIKGHLRYHRQQKTTKMPPNCDNKMYYKDFGVCQPDNLCRYIKNPVQYVRRKMEALQESAPKKKPAAKDGAGTETGDKAPADTSSDKKPAAVGQDKEGSV